MTVEKRTGKQVAGNVRVGYDGSMNQRATAAARRAASARVRLEELDRRLVRMRAGQAATEDELAIAEDRLWYAVESAERALDRLSLAYACSADLHERAAARYAETGQAERAERHRTAAVLGRMESHLV